MTDLRLRGAIVLVALNWAFPLAAQTVRGTVVDSSTSQPIPDATIELRLPNDQVAARVAADKAGQFRIRLRAEGAYRVRVQRIGYRVFESEALVLTAKTDTTLQLRLASIPVELEPLTVATEVNSYLKTSGFYLRKEDGVGHFLDPALVEQYRTRARLSTDIILHVPGVRIMQEKGVATPQLRSCRTIGGGHGDQSNGAQLYIDGVAVERVAFGLMTPDEILAIEVYMGPAEVPLQYGGTNAPCGVILVWTKR